MKKTAARFSEFSDRLLSIGEAADAVGVDKKILRGWRREFPLFEEEGEGKRFTARDVKAARALKRLLVDEKYSLEETHRLITDAGAGAVIAVYGAAARAAHANPAHVLQAAVHSAAAAGFFGAVITEIEDSHNENEDASAVASYAQARLARLPSDKR
ncbi:MAG TPA: MerR family transcriptional regulator [Caulobacterales bacterium]|nr:MerR family transcriptional regulator [Caulobacterales bacterium]